MLDNTINKIKNKNNVKIVCYGDSITYGYPCYAKDGVSQVSLPYPKLLESKLRFYFENSSITVLNKGNVGWQSYQGYKHIEKNVLSLKPDLCILMFGINDCKGSISGGLPVSRKNYEKYLGRCVQTLIDNSIDVLLLTPTPAFIPRLKKFVNIVLDVASTHSLHCVNMYDSIKDIVKHKNENLGTIFLDGIHFRDDAYRYISDVILEEFIRYEISNDL